MKSSGGDIRRAGVSDQDENRQADGVQKKERDDAERNEREGLRKAGLLAKQKEPHAGEDDPQAYPFPSGTGVGDDASEAVRAVAQRAGLDDQVGDERL